MRDFLKTVSLVLAKLVTVMLSVSTIVESVVEIIRILKG